MLKTSLVSLRKPNMVKSRCEGGKYCHGLSPKVNSQAGTVKCSLASSEPIGNDPLDHSSLKPDVGFSSCALSG